MSLSCAAFDYVRQVVYADSAIVLEPGKEYLVESRLVPLARARGNPDVTVFVAAAQRSGDREVRRLIVEALTTNETSWFRDAILWTGLREHVLPALARTRAVGRRLSVWSAACSSGQETYSLAMMLADQLPGTDWSLDLLGTDLSEQMLARARSGRYSQLEINRGLPAPMLVRHFVREGTDWLISPALRERVTFRQLNLATAFPPLPRFDLVLLRNVLIYLDAETKRAILRRVRSVMVPDGYLVLGAAETTIGLDESWVREDIGGTAVYRPGTTASVSELFADFSQTGVTH
ncbi:MAG TPA: CheR family methyltransferase [Actinomycetes bacterium]|nr:CheR family methyltransferase [Actinomycetes bacterium]